MKVSSKEEEAEIRALIAAQSGKQHAGNQFSFYQLVRKISQPSPSTPRLATPQATADANRYARLIALLGKIDPILRTLTEL